jgi:hypothetical protein
MKNMFHWKCGDETHHIIYAENHDEAYEIAIQKRMEWTGEKRLSCEEWFKNNDTLDEIDSIIGEEN